MTKILAYLLLFIFLISISSAQVSNIDSLLLELKKSKEDTNRVNTLNNLAWNYITKGNNDAVIKYATMAREEGEKLNFKNGIAMSYHNIGVMYKRKANYEKALENDFKCLKIQEEIGNRSGSASTYNSIGIIYLNQSEYEKSIETFLKAFKIRELGGNKAGMAGCYNNIALVLGRQRNYVKQLEYFNKALQLMQEIGDKQGVAVAYTNIGVLYRKKGDLEKALENASKSLKLYLEIGDKQGIAGCYSNIGTVYLIQKKLNEALANYQKSLGAARQIGDDNLLARVLGNISNVQANQGKLNDALISLDEALGLFKKIGDKSGLEEIYQAYAELSEKKHDYKSAYEYHKLYANMKDTLFNDVTAKNTAEMNSKFESEKKDKELIMKDAEITKQKAESDKQQTFRNALMIGLLLVLFFALFIFRSYRQKQRANSELASKNKLIEQQKKEVDYQKELVDEKNKEVTDSIHYAKRIQQALLANETLLKENLSDYFILYQPKDIVSGDFYWAHTTKNGFLLCTADCTGHGVPGAFMSLLNISFLNEAVDGQKLIAPNEILNYTRSKIIYHLANDGSVEGGKDGMDCSLLSFDFKNKKMTYAAANNPVWIARDKEILEFSPDKMPVGKHDKDSLPFTQHTVDLQKNDVVYTLTDGFADQFGGVKGKKFMYKELKKLLISSSHLSLSEQKETLKKSFLNWKGKLDQIDDVCIIGVKI